MNRTIVSITIPEEGEPDYTELLNALAKPGAKIESSVGARNTILYVIESK